MGFLRRVAASERKEVAEYVTSVQKDHEQRL
jgi:hypothetical protein